ncbi:hypothetical protein PBRA_002106 [Plasmodiophora brassicae]|uniref:L-type lectin-like domain-containing protein n=1 Tax=Plasmodiophora brassicae TaxID=37360 RepID=A0A0G4J1Q2_PLABS|nr:hypothetical protein PBRA_002106 [Plasmodiophora brassicae]
MIAVASSAAAQSELVGGVDPMRPLLRLVLIGALTSVVLGALPGSPETHRRPIETHHSLHHPFDQSSVYWKYGGSTVMTTKAIRLTPATQSRTGWLWNDYPVESANWEVEIGLRVFSKPHFGGDGFAFWVLSSEMDPSYSASPTSLSGPVFGMRDDFKGFGVIFDTYDNDGRRDNPSIFVVKNINGKFVYNNDNDLADNMVRNLDPSVPYKCTADYRNLGKPVKVLFRYIHGSLHIYVDDTIKETGYKFCLAVSINLEEVKITETHFAFTSMTGEVADAVELTEITTHYIDDSDADIADSTLELSQSVAGTRWRWLYWFVALGTGVSLLVVLSVN